MRGNGQVDCIWRGDSVLSANFRVQLRSLDRERKDLQMRWPEEITYPADLLGGVLLEESGENLSQRENTRAKRVSSVSDTREYFPDAFRVLRVVLEPIDE